MADLAMFAAVEVAAMSACSFSPTIRIVIAATVVWAVSVQLVLDQIALTIERVRQMGLA